MNEYLIIEEIFPCVGIVSSHSTDTYVKVKGETRKIGIPNILNWNSKIEVGDMLVYDDNGTSIWRQQGDAV